jgi:hypothetical protein
MYISISSESTIENIFSNFLIIDGETYQFSIPLYQREYSWREEQWRETFDDLIHSLNKPDMDTDYWGNIIVFKNDANREFEIVDGQQRLITLLLLILSVGEINKPNGFLPLKFKGDNNELWLKIASKLRLRQDEKRHAFNQAIEFFEECIREEGLDANQLLQHIQKTKLSIVIVDDELESNLLFGRLNTRGLPLGQVDLIKHKLFYATKRRMAPTGNDEVLEKWKALFLTTKDLNTTIDQFLEKWWEVHYDLNNETLYSSFQQKLISDDYLSFLESVLASSQQILDLKNNSTGTDNRIGRNLKWLLKISQSEQLWMVLIALEDTVLPSKRRIDFYEQLTVYEFCRAISSQSDFSELDDIYYDFAKNLLSEVAGNRMNGNEVIVEIAKVTQKMVELLPDLPDFIDDFSVLRFDDSGRWEWEGISHEQMLSRYAIYTLNNWLDTTNHGAGVEYRTKDDDEYSIEHIRAKLHAISASSHEYLIGNLVVLEKQINNDLGDIDVDEKLSEYKKSSYPQMKEFLIKKERKHGTAYRRNNMMEWNKNGFGVSDIENRGRYLANSFYERIEEILGMK